MTKIFFTSDTHFGHENIIAYSKRPFASLEEMHTELIRRWNAVVGPLDIVHVLGDFTYKAKRSEAQSILNALNGRKLLTLGNHDPDWSSRLRGWVNVDRYRELNTADQHIILCHYPIEDWNRKAHGSIHFHGHQHTTWFGGVTGTNRIDVGVDANAYAPVELSELLARLAPPDLADVVRKAS